MKESIRERTLQCAQYIVDKQATIRQTAQAFGIGKSTVHVDLSARLPRLNAGLYRQVHAILVRNHDERHLRGGESTRNKYLREKTALNNAHKYNNQA